MERTSHPFTARTVSFRLKAVLSVGHSKEQYWKNLNIHIGNPRNNAVQGKPLISRLYQYLTGNRGVIKRNPFFMPQ